jgi:hypothetical protein
MEFALYLPPVLAIVGLVYMFILKSWVQKQEAGTEKCSN